MNKFSIEKAIEIVEKWHEIAGDIDAEDALLCTLADDDLEVLAVILHSVNVEDIKRRFPDEG